MVVEVLRRHGLFLKKALGQNFLVDENILGKVVSAVEPCADDRIVEIGPGIGTLTVALAPLCDRLVAVEIDRGLTPVLEEHAARFGNISLILADAARIDFGSALGDDAAGPEDGRARWKLVSNLPYYATSPIIMNVLSQAALFSRLVFMVQKEVARRIVAAPGDGDYGAFSVACQYWSSPRVYATVSRNAFLPAPEVDSAIVVMEVWRAPPERIEGPGGDEMFFRVVRTAFGRRRKTLAAALRDEFGRGAVERALAAAGIAPSRRAETLTVREFAALTRELGMKFAKGDLQC